MIAGPPVGAVQLTVAWFTPPVAATPVGVPARYPPSCQ